MSKILDSVNQRTQLVGQNRLELLLFKLNHRQKYGINVFKVREVLQCPKLTVLPRLNSHVRGITQIRGKTLSVIDLHAAVGGKPVEHPEDCFIIISEYNRSVQGFLVNEVERIININWEAVMPPPKGSGRASYLTAVTEVDNELIEILDVEKILDEISPLSSVISPEVNANLTLDRDKKFNVMVIDDSLVARRQIIAALAPLNLNIDTARDGKEALLKLRQYAEDTSDVSTIIPLVISDIEMPEMDGYTLTAEIKNDERLNKIKVILHTSLSGVFNLSMVKKVDANDFISKFNPDELAQAVSKHLSL